MASAGQVMGTVGLALALLASPTFHRAAAQSAPEPATTPASATAPVTPGDPSSPTSSAGSSTTLITSTTTTTNVTSTTSSASTAVGGPSTTTLILRSFKLIVAGDVLPHTQVVKAACGGSLRRDAPCSFERLLQPTQALVSSADLAICHLEVPLAPPGKAVSGYPSFGAPLQLVAGLKATGWDRCSTASNHSIDQGTWGIETTLNALDAHALGHTGTTRNAAEAEVNEIFTINGVRIAHRSYTYGLNGLKLPKGQPFWVDLLSWQKILADVTKARAGGAEVVLVSIHWGQEYRSAPTVEQKRFSAILTASQQIDLIIGHHAHVVQPIAMVNNRWVLYGLGNHLSAQVASKKRPAATQDGVLLEIGFSEQTDHHFVASRPVAHPTWVHPSTRQVFVVREALDGPALPDSLQQALRASQARTSRVVGEYVALPS
jgi:poly-gamma-glutamate capsule biosynthesis protein CapA/YwtB (metallophosphatase superfamily)